VLQLLTVPTAYRWLLTLAFMAVIVVLSLTPDQGRPDDSVFQWLVAITSPPVQKFLHVVVFAILALLWMWTLADVESRLVRILLTLLCSVVLGVALEWFQTQVPGRFGTITDVLLNIAGTVIGIGLAVLLI
jgi:VanZ family protein